MSFRSLLIVTCLGFQIGAFAQDFTGTGSDEKGIADWLFFISPAKTTFQTNKRLSELTDVIAFYKDAALAGELLELGVNTGFLEVEVKDDKATVILFENRLGSLSEAFKLKIKAKGEEGFLEVKARAIYGHLVSLFDRNEEDLSRFEFSKKIENLAIEKLGAVEDAF